MNHVSQDGLTVLMTAISVDAFQLIVLLLDHGADVHLKNQKGVSSLEFACRCTKWNIVKLIQEYNQNGTFSSKIETCLLWSRFLNG